MTYLQGFANPHILIAEFIVLSWINNYITYKLAVDWNLPWHILVIYIVCILVSTTLITPYFYPLRVLHSMREDLSNIQLFGVAIFGASTLFVSIFVLAHRFGWLNAFAISFGASAIAGAALASLAKLPHAKNWTVSHLNPDSIIHS
jgi:hypothetical protein